MWSGVPVWRRSSHWERRSPKCICHQHVIWLQPSGCKRLWIVFRFPVQFRTGRAWFSFYSAGCIRWNCWHDIIAPSSSMMLRLEDRHDEPTGLSGGLKTVHQLYDDAARTWPLTSFQWFQQGGSLAHAAKKPLSGSPRSGDFTAVSWPPQSPTWHPRLLYVGAHQACGLQGQPNESDGAQDCDSSGHRWRLSWDMHRIGGGGNTTHPLCAARNGGHVPSGSVWLEKLMEIHLSSWVRFQVQSEWCLFCVWAKRVHLEIYRKQI